MTLMVGHGRFLFCVYGGTLYRVDPVTSDRWALSDGWEGARSIASNGKALYVVQGKVLFQVDPNTGHRDLTVLDDLDE